MNSKEILSQIAQNLEKIARERDEFKEASANQKEEIINLKAEISALKNDLKLAQESKPALEKVNVPSDNEGIKKRIDGLVEEIDECLALLND